MNRRHAPGAPRSRRFFLHRGLTAIAAVANWRSLPVFAAAAPAPWTFQPDHPIMPAPSSPAAWPRFRERLVRWRAEKRRALGYDGELYERGDFAPWVSRCFACGFLMVNDERFLDARAGLFTPDRLLDEADGEFGGFDALVLWHAYPRIGFDPRNQFDFYRDLPGGLPGLRELSQHLHQRGVKVFVDWNPWDLDTRPEGKPHIDALADLCAAIDADGIFLDTLPKGAGEFRSALDAARPGVVIESEEALPVEDVATHHMSWAEWFVDSDVPGVLRNKWFERRHVQHQVKRWDRDHTSELHTAWMNGSGIMIWENVFGSWNGWCPRDKSILRAMLPIQRRFADVFAGEGWTPLVSTRHPDVYASRWEGREIRLWTLVNRSQEVVEGELIRADKRPGDYWFDVIAGERVVRAAGRLEARGIGCFVAGRRRALGQDFDRFLSDQAARRSRFDIKATVPAREAQLRRVVSLHQVFVVPDEMAEIPGAALRLRTEFRLRECGCYSSEIVPAIREELNRPAIFERQVNIPRFAIDRTPVTNGQFRSFLEASGWRPTHAENFLKHWPDWRTLAVPAGKDDHPAVYVDLEDARAYAAWAGKRLPTEEEWQHAAQGLQVFKWPWGNDWRDGLCNGGADEAHPTESVSIGRNGDTTPVNAFPDGASPFGVLDLCGNVWEWTDSERSDGRTRFALLKGGSCYSRTRSDWYADGGPRPNDFVAKFLLSWPGVDRSATIGFRCASDVG